MKGNVGHLECIEIVNLLLMNGIQGHGKHLKSQIFVRINDDSMKER